MNKQYLAQKNVNQMKMNYNNAELLEFCSQTFRQYSKVQFQRLCSIV